jgi:predicted unusual protein kinase regulating ubiquinone biosynthesis (AarF/ABC1/UbiB family)
LDFENEVKNVKKFRENFKGNYKIVFPEVFEYSKDIIISSYEEGEDISTLEEYDKNQSALNFNCFHYQCLFIDNFIHGDLHSKNWKAQKISNTNEYRLVIYDCGICWESHSTYLNEDMYFGFCYENSDKIINSTSMLLNQDLTEEMKDDIRDLVNTLNNHDSPMSQAVKTLLNIFSKKYCILNKNFLDLMIYFLLIENVLKQNDLLLSNYTKNKCDLLDVNRDRYMNILTYCKMNNVYKKLIYYVETKLREELLNNPVDIFNVINHSNCKFIKIPESDEDTDGNEDTTDDNEDTVNGSEDTTDDNEDTVNGSHIENQYKCQNVEII